MKKSIFILLSLFITLIINPAKAQNLEEYNTTCKQLSVHGHNSIVKCNDKYGVYDKHNKKFIINPKFEGIQKVSNLHGIEKNYYITIIDNKKGLLSTDGIELLTPQYDSISFYYANEPDRLKIKMDNKFGIYSLKKKDFIIQPIYEDIKITYIDNNRFYHVRNNTDNKIINFNGELISEFKIDTRKCINLQKCVIESNTKFGLFDIKNNKYILEPKFDKIISKENIIQVSQNNLNGLYTLDGKPILDIEFTYINPFYAGGNQVNRILVKKNNKYGIYDGENSKYFLKPIYDDIAIRTYKATDIDENKILVYQVQRDNKMMLIDNQCQESLDENFEYISKPTDTRFPVDQLLVKHNGKFGIYNAITHRYLIEPNFDEIVLHTNKKYNNMWEVKSTDKVGLFDDSGNIIFDTIYDSFKFFKRNEKYIGVEQNKKCGVYDIKKQKLSKFIYNDVSLNKFDEVVVKKGNNKNLYTPVVSTLKTTGYVIILIPLAPVYLCTFGIIPILGLMLQ